MPTIAKLKAQRAFLRREILQYDKLKRWREQGREPVMFTDALGRTCVEATKPAKRTKS